MKIKPNLLSIDIGVNYLGACATNFGDQFLLDGKLLKSWSFFYIKKVTAIKAINTKSKRIQKYKQKHFAYIKQYLFKVICYLKRYCKNNQIKTIILGEIPTKNVNDNEYFFNMEYNYSNVNNYIMALFCYNVQNLDIKVVTVKENCTSKISFYDLEPISAKVNAGRRGKRVTRGRFKTNEGKNVHADINACLNFFRKCNICMKYVDLDKCRKNLLLHPKKIKFSDD